VIALVDIDGTLVRGPAVAHGHALCAALGDVWGVAVDYAALRAAGTAGRTDREIARMLLRAHGVPEDEIGPRLADWCRRAAERHRAIAGDHPDPVAVPDATAALARLRDAGAEAVLVTGNIRAIAHEKLARAGLGGWFAADRGGYGDDACDRADVVRVALARSGARPADAVVIGDTPYDVAAARAADCAVVAVATGTHSAAALTGADHVAATLDAAARAALAIPAPEEVP
jgi:phosphoglycolate phosphatase-like HAD superfamily hydrolase